MPALNLAICWESLLNIVIESRSAGNLIDLNLLGLFRECTPEIICCNLILLNPNYGSNSSNNNYKFISYLTGLIEGDGSIIVPKTERSPAQSLPCHRQAPKGPKGPQGGRGKLNYPSIQIVFHLKDLPLALLIQKNLGFGSLIKKKGLNAYVLYINDQKGILNLVNLLNGNMKTPKIFSLYKLIDWLVLINKNSNLKKLPLNKDSLNKDAWLSGFIESEGHFSVRTTLTGKNPKIECKFELSQRQKDPLVSFGDSNELFLANIAKFLNVSLKNTRENTPYPQYRLRTMSLKTNLLLVDYLNEYPLFGSKFLDYNNWKEILNLFNPKFNYSKENIDKILNLKSNMNDKRTVFYWNHLNRFYNLDY